MVLSNTLCRDTRRMLVSREAEEMGAIKCNGDFGSDLLVFVVIPDSISRHLSMVPVVVSKWISLSFNTTNPLNQDVEHGYNSPNILRPSGLRKQPAASQLHHRSPSHHGGHPLSA